MKAFFDSFQPLQLLHVVEFTNGRTIPYYAGPTQTGKVQIYLDRQDNSFYLLLIPHLHLLTLKFKYIINNPNLLIRGNIFFCFIEFLFYTLKT